MPPSNIANDGHHTLIYLVTGERLECAAADYQDKGKHLCRNNGSWNLVKPDAIDDPSG